MTTFYTHSAYPSAETRAIEEDGGRMLGGVSVVFFEKNLVRRCRHAGRSDCQEVYSEADPAKLSWLSKSSWQLTAGAAVDGCRWSLSHRFLLQQDAPLLLSSNERLFLGRRIRMRRVSTASNPASEDAASDQINE